MLFALILLVGFNLSSCWQKALNQEICGLGVRCGPCCCIGDLNVIDCIYSNRIVLFPPSGFQVSKGTKYISIDFADHCPLKIDVPRFLKILLELHYIDFARNCKDKCVTLINGLKSDHWVFSNIECITEYNGTSMSK